MKLLLVSIGLVLLGQQAISHTFGCSLPCGQRCVPYGCGLYSSCGCGLEREENMSHCNSPRRCVPLVVRPQEISKPTLPLNAALTPVPGLCVDKKAIVKPAILQRPVCRSPQPAVSVVDNCHYNQNQHSSTTFSSGCSSGDCRPVLYGGVYPPPTANCKDNEANCVPADAVSLALAYKMTQEQCHQSEDKLQFGFRKLPQELPPKRIIKNNVPEEKIFALNGQIVELRPVKAGCHRSLDDEAAEELLALEEDEERAAEDYPGPIRKVSLGEIGYGPAKLNSPTFINVPVGNIVATAADAIDQAISSSSSSCCGQLPSCRVVAGNVNYKIVPKPEQVCLPPLPVPDDCESAEIPPEEDLPQDTCTCSCVPVVMKRTHRQHQQSCKRSSVTIEKLCH